MPTSLDAAGGAPTVLAPGRSWALGTRAAEPPRPGLREDVSVRAALVSDAAWTHVMAGSMAQLDGALLTTEAGADYSLMPGYGEGVQRSYPPATVCRWG